MRYGIHLQPEAVKDLDKRRKFDAKQILDAMEEHLRHGAEQVSRSRIKRLRGKQHADYRLLVGNFRVFYTVEGPQVRVLRILSKEETHSFYLKEDR